MEGDALTLKMDCPFTATAKERAGDSLSSKADGTFSELAKKELTCSMADKRAYPTTAREEALRESI